MKKNNKLKTFLNIVIMLAFSVGVGYFCLYRNLDEVKSSISGADWRWLAVSIILTLLYLFLGGVVLKLLAQNGYPSYTIWQGYLNMHIGVVFHNITPSSSGGQIMQVYIFKKQGIDYADSTLILFKELIIYKVVVVAAGLVLMVFQLPNLTGAVLSIWLMLASCLFSLALIGGLILLLKRPSFYNWVISRGIAIGSKIHLVKDPAKARAGLQRFVDEFNRSVTDIKANRKLYLKILLYNIARVICYYATPIACMAALHIPIPFSQWLLVITLAAMVDNIAMYMPTPGGSGGMEAAFVLMFSLILTAGQAGSVMLFWRLSSFYFTILSGLILFIGFDIMVQHRKDGGADENRTDRLDRGTKD